MFDAKNKVVLITGAASGFGKLIAERLAPGGAKLVLSDIDEAGGVAVANALNKQYGKDTAVFFKCNVASSAELKKLFEIPVKKWGRLDVAINNAGIGESGLFSFEANTNWRKVLDIDLTAVIEGTELAMNIMRNQSPKGGIIINTASMAGFLPSVAMPIYVAAKFGVVGFTRSLDSALTKAHNIRVVGIAPTFAETPLLTREDASGSNQMVAAAIAQSGTVPVPLVIDAFMRALDDESLQGDILRITRKNGIDVFPSSRRRSML
ncbi:hypothetical protein HK101_008349 [Irineochytrium annulatum]|nr:hypothetical protein HK101_008349 [Irineochytrium annulatum]